MKRIFDLILATLILPVLLPIFLILCLLVWLEDGGPVIYWSSRVGKDNNLFKMPKFRSMKLSTPQVATHLLVNPEQFVTRLGKIMRKTSLDELPQLYSVFVGDMSFVGPRPALFNQDDLINLRSKKNIHKLRPWITGWAQINGRDELPIPKKVEFDEYYLERHSLFLDVKIIFITVFKVFRSEGVSH